MEPNPKNVEHVVKVANRARRELREKGANLVQGADRAAETLNQRGCTPRPVDLDEAQRQIIEGHNRTMQDSSRLPIANAAVQAFFRFLAERF